VVLSGFAQRLEFVGGIRDLMVQVVQDGEHFHRAALVLFSQAIEVDGGLRHG